MRLRFLAIKGFTLTELAIVMVIIALILGSMMMPLTAQQDLKSRQETTKSLNDIREALMAYAAINGRLPCPADGTLTSGASLGKENLTAGACTSASGVLPWIDLGLPEVDAWGHRYTYRVTLLFARTLPQTSFGAGCTATTTTAAFALCTAGDINISTASAGGVSVASNVPAVIISHGTNGLGAYSQQGTQLSGAADDEAVNANPASTTFYARESLDDMVIWISPSLLMGRMLAAGKLP